MQEEVEARSRRVGVEVVVRLPRGADLGSSRLFLTEVDGGSRLEGVCLGRADLTRKRRIGQHVERRERKRDGRGRTVHPSSRLPRISLVLESNEARASIVVVGVSSDPRGAGRSFKIKPIQESVRTRPLFSARREEEERGPTHFLILPNLEN